MTPCINYLNTVGEGKGVSEKGIIVIVLVKYVLTILMFNYLLKLLEKKELSAAVGRSECNLRNTELDARLQSAACPWP